MDFEEKLRRLDDFLANFLFQNKRFEISDMILREDSPHPVEYVETGDRTQNKHAGQMKLLLADEMSIMQGLLHICSKSGTTLQDVKSGRSKVAVVVAGAAPGDHFVDLSSTFGFVDFHLYDPAPRGWYRPLDAKSKRWPRNERNVFLYRQNFELETARDWAGKKGYEHVIFLSDLRTGNGMVTEQVADDMENQRQMTIEVGACYSVLKFRPRYHYDDTTPDEQTLKYLTAPFICRGTPRIIPPKLGCMSQILALRNLMILRNTKTSYSITTRSPGTKNMSHMSRERSVTTMPTRDSSRGSFWNI